MLVPPSSTNLGSRNATRQRAELAQASADGPEQGPVATADLWRPVSRGARQRLRLRSTRRPASPPAPPAPGGRPGPIRFAVGAAPPATLSPTAGRSRFTTDA